MDQQGAAASFDLSPLKDASRARLEEILEQIPADKRVYGIDPALLDPLALLAGDLFAKAEKFHLTGAEPPSLRKDAEIVFLVKEGSAHLLAYYVGKYLARNRDAKIHVIAVPCLGEQGEAILARQRLSGDLKTFEGWDCSMVVLDSDLISLNIPGALRRVSADFDFTPIQLAAGALYSLMECFGPFQRITARGASALRLAEAFRNLVQERTFGSSGPLTGSAGTPVGPSALASAAAGSQIFSQDSTFERLFIFDRLVDPFPLLLPGWTYEALLAERWTLYNNKLTVPPRPGETAQKPLVTYLSSSIDSIFNTLRHMHLSAIPNFAAKITEELRSLDEEGKSIKELPAASQSLRRVRDFMERQKKAQASSKFIEQHIDLAARIQTETSPEETERYIQLRELLTERSKKFPDYVEYCILRGDDRVRVLQLLAAYALSGAAKSKEYIALRKLFVARYGVSSEFLLQTSERIWPQMDPSAHEGDKSGRAKPWFREAQAVYDLLLPSYNAFNQPTSSCYVFNYYSPLLAKILEREALADVEEREEKQEAPVGLQRSSSVSSLAGLDLAPATPGLGTPSVMGAMNAQGAAGVEPAGRGATGQTQGSGPSSTQGPQGYIYAAHQVQASTKFRLGSRKIPDSWEGSSVQEFVSCFAGREEKAKPIAVLVMGGVTFSEYAAFKYVAQLGKAKFGNEFDIVVIGTEVASGKEILRGLEDPDLKDLGV